MLKQIHTYSKSFRKLNQIKDWFCLGAGVLSSLERLCSAASTRFSR